MQVLSHDAHVRRQPTVVRACRRISRSVLAALLVGLFLAFPVAPTVRAAGTVYYVGMLNDDGGTFTDHCANPANADCSLRSAVAAASSGSDSINWTDRVTGPIRLTRELVLSQTLTIDGPGSDVAQLDGNDVHRVLHITAGTVRITGLTIGHGLSSDVGGGIYVQGGSLTLSDCVVANNVVTGPGNKLIGGGIYAEANLTLIRTTVSNNSAVSFETTAAGAPLVGGGIEQKAGTLTVSGSTISGNRLQWMSSNTGVVSGGGIDNQGTLVLTNSTVSGNQVVTSVGGRTGGGIANNGTATVTNSTLTGNSAGQGGGIYNQMTLAVTSSTLTGNSAGQGGGLFLSSGSTTLTDTLVARNTGRDVAGAVTGTSRNNLIGDGTSLTGISDSSQGNRIGTAAAPLDPKLDPNGLRANGSAGPQTVALLPNSPVIDAGGTCPDDDAFTDARGRPRVAACDIGAYEYQPVIPTVTDATAPASGGAATLHGTGFQTGTQLNVAGNIATATATDVNADGTTMTLLARGHPAGSTPIRVTNPGSGHTATGTLIYVPVVTSLSPTSGSVTSGGSVTINGTGFVTGDTSVQFGTTPATVTDVTAMTITVTAPAHAAGAVDVTVTVNGVSATKAGAYTYGTVAPLPPAQPAGAGGGKPAALPGTRTSPGPAGSSGTPAPLPMGR